MRPTRLLLLTALLAGCNCGTTTTDTCKGRAAGDVVITELMIDPDGTDTGNEYVELFNTLGTPVDLKGMQLYFKKLDGTGLKTHAIRAGTAPARGYFTAGDVRMGPNPTWITYAYGDDLGSLTNGEGVVGVRCGTVTLDEVTWTSAPKAGHALQYDGALDPNADTNNDETKWCSTPDAQGAYEGNNIGTPGAPNAECPLVVPTGTCLENGSPRAIVPPFPGDLVITEVMANPRSVADTAGEWVELRGVSDVDLNGSQLLMGTSKSTLTSADCLHVGAGEDVVLAKDADALANGGLPSVLATFTLSLTNSGGVITLANSDAGIDSATLPASLNGISWQLDPTVLNVIDNDDAGAFCRATVRYGDPDAGDFGTPAAPNSACPLPPNPNECVDTVTGLPRAIVKPVVGDVVITEFMANPDPVADADGEWLELLVKSDVDLNGLVLGDERAPGAGTDTVSSTDCISVTAGSYVVFANNADPMVNGGLQNVAGVITFGLTNSGTPALAVYSEGVELDRLAYTSSSVGIATQLSDVYNTPADNDVPANLCPTPAGNTYGDVALADGGVQVGQRGTPGAANATCP